MSAATRRPMRTNSGNRSGQQHADNMGLRGMTSTPSDHRVQRNTDLEIEGVYKNPKLTYNLTTLVGCTVEVLVKNGKRYEGIFRTFSPELEVVLECVHLLDINDKERIPCKEAVVDTLVINFPDLVALSAINADTKYGEADSFTDSAISKSQVNGGNSGEFRELTPFVLEESDSPVNNKFLEETSNSGWTPEKMFQAHQEKFGVQSSFDEEAYTTKLPSADTPDYHKRRLEAERHASEIEASLTSRRHTELENGDDLSEEMRHSAVIRPQPVQPVHQPVHQPHQTQSHPPKFSRLPRERMDNKALSQSARLNGRESHQRHRQDQNKRGHATPTVAGLKNWKSNFKMGGTTTSQSSPDSPSVKPEGAGEQTVKSGPTKSPATQSPPKDVDRSPSTDATSSVVEKTPVASPTATAPNKAGDATSPAPAVKAKEEPAKPETQDPVSKSTLNPEAKEFTPKLPAAATPTPAHQPPQHVQGQRAPKTATVSVVEARNPKSSAETMTPQQAMGPPLYPNPHAPYILMSHPSGPRLQRVPSYQGEGPAAHVMPSSQSIVPLVSIQNGIPAHVNMPGAIHAQQPGNMPPVSHNAPMHPHMTSQTLTQGAPPTSIVVASAPHQHHSAYPSQGQYVYQVPGPPAGPPANHMQPPLQPSPHNPSPSPAPMSNSNGAVTYSPYPPPQPQQFSQPNTGSSQYPASVVYFPPNQGPGPSQYPFYTYTAAPGYPANFNPPQQQ